MAIKVKIGSKHQENLERIKGLVRLAVGDSSLKNFVHIYQDSEKRITVEPSKDKMRISIFYNSGLLEKEIQNIFYSRLDFS